MNALIRAELECGLVKFAEGLSEDEAAQLGKAWGVINQAFIAEGLGEAKFEENLDLCQAVKYAVLAEVEYGLRH